MNLVFKAYSFAERKHRGQQRKYSDQPYFLHPLRVAYAVQNYSDCIKVTDENLVCAALAHDTIEDCGVTYQELVEEFNSDVAGLVLELTQPDHDPEIKKLKRAARHQLLLEKLKGVSERAKRIKYFDRLDNLREVDLSNDECYGFLKRRYIQESYDIHKTLDLFLTDDPLLKVILDLARQCKVDLQ